MLLSVMVGMKAIYARSRRNRVANALHIVWTTTQRAPMVTDDIEARVYRTITAEAEKLGATVLAIGGMPDHVHLIVLLPAKTALATLMQQIKGVSAHVINTAMPGEVPRLRWANGYSAFSMSRSHRDAAVAYVRDQKLRHADLALRRGWEDDASPRERGVERSAD